MNQNQSDKGVTGEYPEINQKIWAGEYFGPDGAVSLAGKKYIGSFSLRNSDKERAGLALMYACTLYSAIGNCVAQVKKFRLEFLLIGVELLWHLNKVISRILYETTYMDFNASQKEVFMAYLLICRWINPFSFFSYRNRAIKIGKDIISEDNCSHSTYFLVMARLSKLWFYSKRKACKKSVSLSIHNPIIQIELGWKTINRLARLIGDKEIKEYSAPLTDSKDVMIKSGM